MKYSFVLDENVAIIASTLENEKGERDLTCSRLVQLILANCHSIPWSTAILARWSRQVQGLRAQQKALAPSFLAVFSVYQWSGPKCPLPPEGNPPALSDESSWSTKLQDDCEFIRLAAHFRSFLVTTDATLRRDIASLRLDTRYAFRLVNPNEAVPYATTPVGDGEAEVGA